MLFAKKKALLSHGFAFFQVHEKYCSINLPCLLVFDRERPSNLTAREIV